MPKRRGVFSRLVRIAFWLVAGWLTLTCAIVLVLRWVPPPATSFMLLDRWAASKMENPYPFRHRWTDANAISSQMKVAVIAAEDQRFPNHFGFDLDSINDALEEMESGRRVRGASTISQQVAKNLFLWPGQSWVRKGLEAYFTVLVEALWPKQRILEVYLNIAEFGKGVFGVGAASEAFFGKPPAQLNAYDGALLAAVLPSPKRMSVSAPSPYVRSRQQWIMSQMRRLGGPGILRELE